MSETSAGGHVEGFGRESIEGRATVHAARHGEAAFGEEEIERPVGCRVWIRDQDADERIIHEPFNSVVFA